MVCASASITFLPHASQVASLDDAKALQKEENSAAKTIALEHLGLIAARIQSGVLRYKSANVGTVVTAPLKSLDEVRFQGDQRTLLTQFLCVGCYDTGR